MTNKTAVSSTSNLFDYFKDQVEIAQNRLALDLAPDTSLYLANLMQDRARSDRPAPPEQTLAELHARASSAPPGQRAQTYRELGDRSLYALGYFRESIARKAVGPNYYYDMGSSAYLRADQVFKHWFADAFGPVFTELAHQFKDCVDILDHIRSDQDAQPDLISRLYDEWLRTGDPNTAARLRRRGVLLPNDHWPES